jgi:hypothetical protein
MRAGRGMWHDAGKSATHEVPCMRQVGGHAMHVPCWSCTPRRPPPRRAGRWGRRARCWSVPQLQCMWQVHAASACGKCMRQVREGWRVAILPEVRLRLRGRVKSAVVCRDTSRPSRACWTRCITWAASRSRSGIPSRSPSRPATTCRSQASWRSSHAATLAPTCARPYACWTRSAPESACLRPDAPRCHTACPQRDHALLPDAAQCHTACPRRDHGWLPGTSQ